MSKFTNMISASNSSTLMSRSEDLAEEVVLELNSFINNLKKEKSQLKNKINKLTDLAPENSTSLRPGHADFDASVWVKNLHHLGCQNAGIWGMGCRRAFEQRIAKSIYPRFKIKKKGKLSFLQWNHRR